MFEGVSRPVSWFIGLYFVSDYDNTLLHSPLNSFRAGFRHTCITLRVHMRAGFH